MKSVFLLTIAAAPLAHAAISNTGYANPGTDGTPFLYETHVTFSEVDSWTTQTSVWGWSYVNLDAGSDPNAGWGHGASWYLVELTEATYFQLSLSSEDTSARPGFVLYAGESIEDNPAGAHSFSNNGQDIASLNGAWDLNGPGGTPGLIYETHAFDASQSSITQTVYLEAGRYTLAVGNGAASSTNPGDKVLDLNFTTIPEPSVTLLGALGSLMLVRRRR